VGNAQCRLLLSIYNVQRTVFIIAEYAIHTGRFVGDKIRTEKSATVSRLKFVGPIRRSNFVADKLSKCEQHMRRVYAFALGLTFGWFCVYRGRSLRRRDRDAESIEEREMERASPYPSGLVKRLELTPSGVRGGTPAEIDFFK